MVIGSGLITSGWSSVRAWQGRIDVDVPLPVPVVEVASANPFALAVDEVPRLISATPPRKVEVAGDAVVAAYVDEAGDCEGAVPLEVPFPGMTRSLIEAFSDGRYEPATSGERPRASWVVVQTRIEGKIKEASVVSHDMALPVPDDPPEPIRPALPPPSGRLLQLPVAEPSELTALVRPKRLKIRQPGTDPVVSLQALVHINDAGRCDRFVPIVLDPGLSRWFSGYLATWTLEPAVRDGKPVGAWVIYTARIQMELSSLQSRSFRVLADRTFDPS